MRNNHDFTNTKNEEILNTIKKGFLATDGNNNHYILATEREAEEAFILFVIEDSDRNTYSDDISEIRVEDDHTVKLALARELCNRTASDATCWGEGKYFISCYGVDSVEMFMGREFESNN